MRLTNKTWLDNMIYGMIIGSVLFIASLAFLYFTKDSAFFNTIGESASSILRFAVSPFILLFFLGSGLVGFVLNCPEKDMGLWHQQYCGDTTTFIGLFVINLVIYAFLGLIIGFIINKVKRGR